ncbi:MAG TPA: hypothetical protein VHR27_06540, partial [Blastocatellia bacterium]|nr:hypothetical protein [Blastocatellia bacterium]
VRHLGESLVKSIETSMESGVQEASELVACERVVLADSRRWLKQIPPRLTGRLARFDLSLSRRCR